MLTLPVPLPAAFDGGREAASSLGDTDNAWPLATSTSFLDKASTLFQGPTQGCALEALSPVITPQMSAESASEGALQRGWRTLCLGHGHLKGYQEPTL